MSTRNNKAWTEIFEEFEILKVIQNEGVFAITSTEINPFRQARLMTKFDHYSQLPRLFKDNDLSILPTYRGGYIIGQFEVFSKFNIKQEVDTHILEFPRYIESLDHTQITSESIAINCSYISGILKDFIDDYNIVPTVSGRMSSSKFSFDINTSGKLTSNIIVENSQIEIDGGYEGESSLNLIEAKNYISNDFLIRQIYYPYRLWQDKIGKRVRPIFLTYSNGTFHLREYQFNELEHYNSLELVRQKKYILKDFEEEFNAETLMEILDTIEIVDEPEIPFPQANSFERVINLCELIQNNNRIYSENLIADYDFGGIDPRQHDYYANAALYLGLIKSYGKGENKYFELTDNGIRIMSLSVTQRQIEFSKLILEHRVFNEVMRLTLLNGEVPDTDEIVAIMRDSNLYKVRADSTFVRRSSTITGWINWLSSQLDV